MTVQLTDLQGLGFPMTMRRIQLAELLQKKYPQHNWEKLLFLKGRYGQQKRLERTVQHLFPVIF